MKNKTNKPIIFLDFFKFYIIHKHIIIEQNQWTSTKNARHNNHVQYGSGKTRLFHSEEVSVPGNEWCSGQPEAANCETLDGGVVQDWNVRTVLRLRQSNRAESVDRRREYRCLHRAQKHVANGNLALVYFTF